MRSRWLFLTISLVVATVPLGKRDLQATAPFGAQEKKPAERQQPLSPAEAARTFNVPDDLRVEQVLAEPLVKQPLSLSFDEKGRLWVVNYEQYPYPAGLKILSRDKYWRVVYDKVPAPPPHHVRGKDRITIHEDSDGDGGYDKHSVFIDGLSIATSCARGRGGVFVLNPPYLLFYPTRLPEKVGQSPFPRDADQPTGDPVVLLQGFGLEDCHSTANSLRWGVDGWLYGTHGSTVSSRITIPSPPPSPRKGERESPVQMIGQHVWRYHPEKKVFEIFAEGGGNAFGIEVDALGRLYSGHNGGDTRGFHYVQGGYYRKGFEKHGVLANPFAFGFFEAMAHNKAQRFSHTFVINEGHALPDKYLGKMFAVAPLQSHVMLSDVMPDRSSVKTKDLEPILTTSDKWFRPVDIKPGPDGLYVADFYEQHIAHLRHYEGLVDNTTGRVYRISGKDRQPQQRVDYGALPSARLVDQLISPNRWVRETVLRVLGDRRDASIIPTLRQRLFTSQGQRALSMLWALNLSGGLTPDSAAEALAHPEPMVRAWTVRLLGDEQRLGADMAKRLAELAAAETSVHVRSQLAASAKRVPAAEGLPIVRNLIFRDDDAGDIHVPLLLWWAIEANCAKERDRVIGMWRDSTLWTTKLAEGTILPRLMKRFALAGTQKDLQTCTELFRLAPEKRHGQILLKGFEEAFKGRSSAGLPPELLAEIGKLGGGSLAFGVRLGKDDAVAKALAVVQNPKAPAAERVGLIEVLGETRQPRCVPVLLGLLAAKETVITRSALTALQAYKDDRIGAEVVKRYPSFDGELRETAETLLLSRREWSKQWLAAVDQGAIPTKAIPRASVRQMLLHDDDGIKGLVRKHWGDVKGATTAEMQQEINRLLQVVGTGGGDPLPGKKLFTARCATCHTLHAQGGTVGPDLTTYKRDDAANLMLHVVNPNAEIREGFETHVIVTESGRTLNGIVVEKDNRVVVLRTADGQRVVLPRDEIETERAAGVSLMPEGGLHGLSEREVRDLFAYLRSSQPLNYTK
ncbi:MAG: c-type cytochrome [Gemmataceae bacterium]|nr:c-type cytochrome [Gemmataceae bacterium]